MQKKDSSGLVEIFTTARDENLRAAKNNFEYLYKNAGYSLENLADIFLQIMPILKWDRSAVYHFLHPETAEKTGHKVSLLSATPDHISKFLKISIQLRQEAENEFRVAETMMRDANMQWGIELSNATIHLSTRQAIIHNIRENFREVYKTGNYSYEQLASFFEELCPAHIWDKSKVRRFLSPEKTREGQGQIVMSYASPKMLSDLLRKSIDERMLITTHIPHSLEPPQP